jgi:hypothetical protein
MSSYFCSSRTALYMCPHTTLSTLYMCTRTTLYMCPHTGLCVLIYLFFLCYSIYVSSCICSRHTFLYMCPHTTICMCPHNDLLVCVCVCVCVCMYVCVCLCYSGRCIHKWPFPPHRMYSHIHPGPPGGGGTGGWETNVDYTHVRGRGWKCLRRGVREWSSLVIYISQGTGGQVWRKSTCVYILIDHSSKFTQYIYNSGSQCRTGGQVWRKSTCAYILIDIDFQSCRCTGWILKNDTEEIEFLSSRVSWSVFSLQTKWECTTRNVV